MSIPFTRVKIVTVEPIPNASTRIATRVVSSRSACSISVFSSRKSAREAGALAQPVGEKAAHFAAEVIAEFPR